MKWLLIKSLDLIAQLLYICGEKELTIELLTIRYKIQKRIYEKNFSLKPTQNVDSDRK